MSDDLLTLIGADTPLRRTASTGGGEYSGPCPLCCRGRDRFKVWPAEGRWGCLGPRAGRSGCDVYGDADDYRAARRVNGPPVLSPRRSDAGPWSSAAQAAHPSARQPPLLAPDPPPGPSPAWQVRAAVFAAACAASLAAPGGAKARAWLRGRGLSPAAIATAGLGYHPCDRSAPAAAWGLPADHAPLSLPRGIVIPWRLGGEVTALKVRRPAPPLAGPKYLSVAGGGRGLYRPTGPALPRPAAVLVEGEFDALVLHQEAGDLAAAFATGSTAGGRDTASLYQLLTYPLVLVAFDVDDNQAGDRAADWWLDALGPRAVRWRPLAHDITDMLIAGQDVRYWVYAGRRSRC